MWTTQANAVANSARAAAGNTVGHNATSHEPGVLGNPKILVDFCAVGSQVWEDEGLQQNDLVYESPSCNSDNFCT